MNEPTSEQMNVTHLLIDLEGTITDSHSGIARSLQYAFTETGYEPPSDERVRDVIGPPFELTFPSLGVPEHDFHRVVAKYRERYNDVGLFENRIYDGVVEMLHELRDAGVVLALATAKPEEPARRITAHFGLTELFHFEAGAGTHPGEGRTKAQVITYALDALGIEGGSHVLMLGDRDHDVEGAAQNGIDCIGVTWGFGSVDELTEAGAAVIANTPADVVPAVLGTYRSAPA